ncbi:hypothetical protein BH24BAC1_BH24BAC1_33330 [soil metagenome]
MKNIEMIVERTNTGYSAYTDQYPVFTAGDTFEELKANMLEALNLYFEEEGRTITPDDLKITLDLPQFFDFYKVINASALGERIGMSQSLLAQYIRGIKKPTPKQTERIMRGIQLLGKELAEIRINL